MEFLPSGDEQETQHAGESIKTTSTSIALFSLSAAPGPMTSEYSLDSEGEREVEVIASEQPKLK